MILNKFIEVFNESIQDRKASVVKRLCGHGIASFEEYRFCIGELTSLNYVEELAKKLQGEFVDNAPFDKLKHIAEVTNEEPKYY